MKTPEHKRPDPEMIDDDAPEVTEEMLKRARRGRDVFPEMIGAENARKLFAGEVDIIEESDEEHERRLRGRPKADVTAERISLRVPPDVLAFFKEGGKGWQTRMNDALAEYAARHK